MEAAPVFASTAITSGLPPVPGSEQARAITYGHTSLASTTEAVSRLVSTGQAELSVAPAPEEKAVS